MSVNRKVRVPVGSTSIGHGILDTGSGGTVPERYLYSDDIPE
jgi:hypothetical protein